MFTGLLVAISGGTAVYTLWLVRRLFTTTPAPGVEAGPSAADRSDAGVAS
jgi:hypothetical protein